MYIPASVDLQNTLSTVIQVCFFKKTCFAFKNCTIQGSNLSFMDPYYLECHSILVESSGGFMGGGGIRGSGPTLIYTYTII